jgi:hypothetical protein
MFWFLALNTSREKDLKRCLNVGRRGANLVIKRLKKKQKVDLEIMDRYSSYRDDHPPML